MLGIPAGLAANAWLRSVMQTFFPLPVLRTPMQLGVFAQGAALGLAVSLLATAIPLRRALTVTPVEAIRVGARAARSSGAGVDHPRAQASGRQPLQHAAA